MATERWTRLQDYWHVRKADSLDSEWLPVSHVPTEVHLDLLDNKKIAEPFQDLNELSSRWVAEETWTYQTTFAFSGNTDDFVDLIFEGLDTFAVAKLNGSEILKSDNMFHEHRVDVRNFIIVSDESKNVLHITFSPARAKGLELVKQHPEHRFIVHQTEIGRAPIRKAQYHWGWDWGPIFITCGPWKPVWLHTYTSSVSDVWVEYDISPDLENVDIRVYASVVGNSVRNLTYELAHEGETISSGTMEAQSAKGAKATHRASTRLVKPSLWWPHGYGSQDMYDVKVSFTDSSPITANTTKVGFRKTQLVQENDEFGTSFYFRINNMDIFCGGACWIPADSFVSRITPERYRAWIQLMAEGNQVMVRVWGGGIYEPKAFYDACDEFGVLVWQDFMFACANYPAYPTYLESVEVEARTNMRRLRNHASVVIWAGNNEDYQIVERYGLEYRFKEDKDPNSWLKTNFPARYIYEHLLPNVVAEELPGAIYHPSSPWGNGESTVQKVDPTVGDIHQWNMWHGTMEPYQRLPEMGGRFVSEFGMEAYPHMSTLKTFSSNEDELRVGSVTMEHHNKAIGHSRRIMSYVSENFDLSQARDLGTFAALTQALQAYSMDVAYRSWRRDWRSAGSRKCGGVLTWQLNDCWPTISWAIVDYFLVPKVSYYAIKRALAPVAVNVQRKFRDWTMKPAEPGLWHRDTSHIDPQPLYNDVIYDVWVSSCQPIAFEATLKVTYVSLATGQNLGPEHIQKVMIKPNGTTEILSEASGPAAVTEAMSPDEPFDVKKLDPYVIHATLLSGTSSQQILSEDISWPEPDKYNSNRDPGVRVTYSRTGEQLEIVMDAKKPIRCIIFSERPGMKLTDNGFWLLPGSKKQVIVTGAARDEEISWSCC